MLHQLRSGRAGYRDDAESALAEAADRPAEWPGLGRRDPSPMRIVVVPDARRLAELTGGRAPSWGVAIAVPGARTIAATASSPVDAYRERR